jgi:chaperonin GroES
MTNSNIHPVAGYLLVEPKKKDKTTASGIVLTDTHEDKPQEGVVLAIGPAVLQDKQEVKAPCAVGDIVVYREWGGKEYKENNVELLLLKFDDIMAIIKNS